MSQFKIMAMEGLRTVGQDETDNVLGDTYTEEEERKQKAAEEEKAVIKVDNENAYEDNFEDEEGSVEKADEQRETPRIEALDLDSSSRNTSTDKLDEIGQQPYNKKPKKRGKMKKFKTSSSSKPPPLNLYQDQLRDQLCYSRDRSSSFNQDTMSDQEGGRRRGRKLHRRVQMKKYHSLEHDVEQAGRDRLEQKYYELEQLMTQPLVDGRKVHLPVQQMPQTSKSNKQQRRPQSGFKGNNSGNRMGAWVNDNTQDEEEGTDRQAYATIHKLQTSEAGRHLQTSYNNQRNATQSENTTHQSPYDTKLTSKPPVPQRHKTCVDIPSTTSGASQPNDGDDSKPQENGFDHSSSDDEAEDKFGNVSPRSIYLPTEMHLKYSDNPKLQEWLRRKNIEHRQARKAERAKKRQERSEKQAEIEQKAALREKSTERVKQWMDKKRKEAVRHQKEEKRRRKQEAQEQAAVRAKSAEHGIRGRRIDRPQSAPATGKPYIPIKRPESAARLENGAYTAPKPPDTKFVYKRPVSGRVRLMKIQNERNAKARNAEQKKLEELTPEEKEKKMRMSYDAWLVTKRKEDADKRKEAKRQKDLIKSDPEMDRLIPELAVRRIEKISSEKKNIETGVTLIDEDVNKRFGGGAFGKDGEKVNKEQVHDSIAEPSSYNLTVEETATTLAELNSRAKPVAAKTRMPIPQSALSPRRPQSAKVKRDCSPKVRTIMDTDHMAEPNPFKLPFSDDLGVPLHVRRVQERIFPKQMASQSNDSKRPEPQGCASVESATCPKGADGPTGDAFPKGVDSLPKPETTPRSSLVLLQQIEDDAVKSEQRAKQATLSHKAPASTDEQMPSSEAGEELQEEDETESDASSDASDDTESASDNVEEETDEKYRDYEQEQEQDDVKDKSEREKPEELSSEERSHQELKKSDGVIPHAQETEQHAGEQSVPSQPESAEDNDKNLQGTGESSNTQVSRRPDSDAEDTPRRSMKRVSFSEDLTTVFEPPSAETSSNFDDERGEDNEEGDPYMSLDDVPDPD